MKYIGVDYGTKRIGLAVSDDDGGFAFPHSIISTDSALTTISDLVDAAHAEAIIIGYSVASNGAENNTAVRAEKFKEKLLTLVAVPIYFEREDFSTYEAHRYQTKAGNRDDSAAAIILQRFLDKKSKTA